MKLAELGISVDVMSLVPVKRSHSVCAQGGINSVNDYTRQQGDDEWKHFDDTVYGGDFLNNQPPVKEMAYWAPTIIDLMESAGSNLQSHNRRILGSSTFWRNALQTDSICRCHDGTTTSLRTRRTSATLGVAR